MTRKIENGEIYDKIQEVKKRYAEVPDCELLMGVFERTQDVTIQEINQMDVLFFHAYHSSAHPLSSGGTCFIVSNRDENGEKSSDPEEWLKDNGYEDISNKRWDTGILYVNIDTKVYRTGMPGISFGKPIGGRVITFDEFIKVTDILIGKR